MNTLHPTRPSSMQVDFLFGPGSDGPATIISAHDSKVLLPHMHEHPGFTRFSTDGTVSGYSRAPKAGEDATDWMDSQRIEGNDRRPDGMDVRHRVDIQPPLSLEDTTRAAEVIGRHLLAAQLGEAGLNPASIANELRDTNVPFGRVACSAAANIR